MIAARPNRHRRRIETVVLLSLPGVVGCQAATARYASGDFDYRTENSTLDDRTDARLIGVRLESERSKRGVVSGGLEGELLLTDDDLFTSPTNAFSVVAYEITPFVTFRPDFGSMFRAPIDLGLTYHHLALRPEASSRDTVWQTFGVKLAVHPELDLVRGTEGALGLYGTASGMIGITTAETEGTDVDEFNGDSWLVGLEGGLKYRHGSFFLGGGYLSRRFVSAETDRSAGPVLPGVDHEFQGWTVFAGVVF